MARAGIAAVAGMAAIEHAFAPDHVNEKGQTNRPEHNETQHHGDDPGSFASFVKPSLGAGEPIGPCGKRGICGGHKDLRV